MHDAKNRENFTFPTLRVPAIIVSVSGASEGYSSSTASEHSEHTEQNAVSSKKPDSDKKDSQASSDKNSKGPQSESQPSGDCVSPCLEDDLRNNSRTQKSTESTGLVKLQSSCSQNSDAVKSGGNDEGGSILKQASETSAVSKPPTVQQMPKNQAKQSVPEDLNKQSQKLSSTSQRASKSGEGLNLISKLIEAEPAKQFTDHPQTEDISLGKPLKDSKRKGSSSSVSPLSDVFQDGRIESAKQSIDQKQTDDLSLARPPKDAKRRGSSSSLSALSDIIQDIKTSPRDAKVSAENIPTKGMIFGFSSPSLFYCITIVCW